MSQIQEQQIRVSRPAPPRIDKMWEMCQDKEVCQRLGIPTIKEDPQYFGRLKTSQERSKFLKSLEAECRRLYPELWTEDLPEHPKK